MLLLDTSALSGVMRRDAPCLERLRRLAPGEVALCSPVAAEISFGLSLLPPRSRRRRLLQREYDLVRGAVGWFDWTEAAAERFGVVKADLRSRGVTVDDLDIVVSSIALVEGATVATRNPRHFEPVAGLTVEDWGEPWPGIQARGGG
jgi:predicted nucleic acid-binding protein